jgi:ABC-type phosphate/phosphonate transport system substrate-binding protein
MRVHRRTYQSFAVVGIVLGLFQLFALPCLPQQKGAALSPFYIGFTSSLLIDVNRTDAIAATKVWTSTIARKKRIDFDPVPLILDDAKAFIDAFRNNRIDIAGVTAREFLEINEKVPLTPHFLAIRKGAALQDNVILVHTGSGINILDDLAGKDILLLGGLDGNIAKVWLETLVMEKGFPTLDRFFGARTRIVYKASQAVLPVYFKQATACMAPRLSFETMVELNPQLRNQLKIIVTSPAFAPLVICTKTGYDVPIKSVVLEEMQELHKDPEGQQLLMFFKVDHFIPFDPALLEGTRHVLAQHAKAEARLRQKSAAN